MPHTLWYTKGTEQNIICVIIILSIGGNFMLKQTKIQYHYYFPNLPISDNDIQALHTKMTDILWTAESCIYELNHQKIHLPKIFISDDIVTKTYGKYDYKSILKEIKKFSKKFPYSCVCEILEQLESTIKHIEDGSSLGTLKELIDYLVSKIDHAENTEEHQAITKIIAMLKNTKRTINTLGTYNHHNNKITLYINNIVDYFSKAPSKDLDTQIKTGLEIVLAHEVFHAIQYHLVIFENKKAGKSLWEYTAGHKDYRSTVLEGLARWFEYRWCTDYQYINPIYNWHKEQIEKELRTYDYPRWPYAAAKVFIQNSKPLIDEPTTVLYTLLKGVLRQRKSCWRSAFEALERLDIRRSE